MLRGLLDPAAAPEAERVLTNVLMDNVFQMSAAMPAALPFLFRLLAERQLPVRSELLDILLVAAEFSLPVDPGDERAVLLLGSDDDHPEREQCRAVFAEHASLLTKLPAGWIDAADRARLERAAGMR
ncbi:hypothetical protein ACFV6E_13740 [Streptomyces sp. NPDC059785]|uniref:hypothetical protein n=1 Tax=unclassified Streptomyces TaxID=2593676 RepID=UPI0036620E17